MYRLYRIDAQIITKSIPDRNITSNVKSTLSKNKSQYETKLSY